MSARHDPESTPRSQRSRKHFPTPAHRPAAAQLVATAGAGTAAAAGGKAAGNAAGRAADSRVVAEPLASTAAAAAAAAAAALPVVGTGAENRESSNCTPGVNRPNRLESHRGRQGALTAR